MPLSNKYILWHMKTWKSREVPLSINMMSRRKTSGIGRGPRYIQSFEIERQRKYITGVRRNFSVSELPKEELRIVRFSLADRTSEVMQGEK